MPVYVFLLFPLLRRSRSRFPFFIIAPLQINVQGDRHGRREGRGPSDERPESRRPRDAGRLIDEKDGQLNSRIADFCFLLGLTADVGDFLEARYDGPRHDAQPDPCYPRTDEKRINCKIISAAVACCCSFINLLLCVCYCYKLFRIIIKKNIVRIARFANRKKYIFFNSE